MQLAEAEAAEAEAAEIEELRDLGSEIGELRQGPAGAVEVTPTLTLILTLTLTLTLALNTNPDLNAGRDRGHQGRRLPGRLLRHRANQGRGRSRGSIREGVCCVQTGRAIGDGDHVTFGALCLAVGVAKARHH